MIGRWCSTKAGAASWCEESGQGEHSVQCVFAPCSKAEASSSGKGQKITVLLQRFSADEYAIHLRRGIGERLGVLLVSERLLSSSARGILRAVGSDALGQPASRDASAGVGGGGGVGGCALGRQRIGECSRGDRHELAARWCWAFRPARWPGSGHVVEEDERECLSWLCHLSSFGDQSSPSP